MSKELDLRTQAKYLTIRLKNLLNSVPEQYAIMNPIVILFRALIDNLWKNVKSTKIIYKQDIQDLTDACEAIEILLQEIKDMNEEDLSE